MYYFIWMYLYHLTKYVWIYKKSVERTQNFCPLKNDNLYSAI